MMLKASLGVFFTVLLGCSVVSAVDIEFVAVGDPGNLGEWSGESYGGIGPDRICGSVSYVYKIGKYEITAGQYCEFLNAVAANDTYGLYSNAMWLRSDGCKIEQHDNSGNFSYTVASEWANRPVNYVNYWDACRFTNWLHNGQPTGAQDASTTEDGAYTINGYDGNDGREITRNPGAKYALPNEDEWYKAAYYDPRLNNGTGGYWDYPTKSNSMPSNELYHPDRGNNANYYDEEYTIGPPYYTAPD